MKVAVLAVQGAFEEHEKVLQELGAQTIQLRQAKDLEDSFDALVLPGGESTVMRKLLLELDIYDALKEKIMSGLPVFGTCAGLILLADEVEAGVPCFGTMNITAKRNAYGRQLGSFHTEADVEGIGEVPMTFIRAPYVADAGDAQVLATVEDRIVAVKYKNQLALAFHPELDDNDDIHKAFLKMCERND